jgi:hypothetical protein
MIFMKSFRNTTLFFFLCLFPLIVYSDCDVENIRYEQFLENISEEDFITLMSECSIETLQVNTELVIEYVNSLKKAILAGDVGAIDKSYKLSENKILTEHGEWFKTIIMNSMTTDNKSLIVKKLVDRDYVESLCRGRSSFFTDTPEWNVATEQIFIKELVNFNASIDTCFGQSLSEAPKVLQ